MPGRRADFEPKGAGFSELQGRGAGGGRFQTGNHTTEGEQTKSLRYVAQVSRPAVSQAFLPVVFGRVGNVEGIRCSVGREMKMEAFKQSLVKINKELNCTMIPDHI